MKTLSASISIFSTRFIYSSTACLLLAFATFTPPSYAQSTDGSEDIFNLSLEELLKLTISVSSLFEESELYVPSSVSKVTESEWRKHGAEKTFDAIEQLPGVYVTEYYHGQMIPTFRGFTGTEQYNSFLLLLDGMALNNYSSSAATYGTPNFALANLSSIEVIRGPGSALYGADAFNGVVSLNTWNTDVDTLSAGIEAGSFGYWQGEIHLRQSIGDKSTLTSTFSSSSTHDENIKYNFHPSFGSGLVEGNVRNDYKNISSSHKLKLHNTQLAVYFSQHNINDGFGPSEVFGAFPNGVHSDGKAEMKAIKLDNTMNLIDSWMLESKIYQVKDSLHGSFGVNEPGQPPADTAFDWDSEDIRIGAGLTVKKPLVNSQWQFVGGISYDQIKVEELGIGMTGKPLLVENADRKVKAVFTQFERRFLNNSIQLIIGGRHDDYSDIGDYFSPRIGLIFHPVETSAIKLLYGKAFRTPSINEQTNNGIIKGGGMSLLPEEVDTGEIIWIRHGSNWHSNIGVYLSETNKTITIEPHTEPGFILQYTNGGSAKSYGTELELKYFVNKWTLAGNYSYNKSKIIDPIPGEESLSAYPAHILNWSLQYQMRSNLTITLDNSHHKDRQTPSRPEVTPSYFENKALGTFSRTNVNISWQNIRPQATYALWFTISDVFDRADTLTTLTMAEEGVGTPGRKATLGVRISL